VPADYTGNGKANLGSGRLPTSLRHQPSRFGAHRPVLSDHRLGNTEQDGLGRIAVSHKASFEEDGAAGNVCKTVRDQSARAGLGHSERELPLRHPPGNVCRKRVFAHRKDMFSEPRLHPFPCLAEFSRGRLRGGFSHRQDQVILREIRVEPDPDTEAGQIGIGHRLVHRRLGETEELEGKRFHVQRSLRECLTKQRDHLFKEHPPRLGGNTRDNRNDPSLTTQRKACRRPHRVGDDLRPLGENSLLGVIFSPPEVEPLKTGADMRENIGIAVQPQAEGPGQGRRRDVVGRGAQPPGDNHPVHALQKIGKRIMDRAVVIAHGDHPRDRPPLLLHRPANHCGIGILDPSARQLVSDRQYSDFHVFPFTPPATRSGPAAPD